MTDLLPCPFCGSSNVDPKGWMSSGGETGPACDECGGSTESVERWNTRATAHREAHKVMTPEEYASMPLKGWHEVCRDVDGFGGTGVRFLGQ